MANDIYSLIGKAMKKVGAIGKDAVATDKNGRMQYKFRGIDAVYNALNPVMSELGLFVCPEIIDQKREERTTTSGGVLKYAILTIKFTMFAPDGSSVSCTVVGEGMDSGDKASNKAMSVAMKYAMFQLFMIPTEEMVDPDGEVHNDLTPKKPETKPGQAVQKSTQAAQNAQQPATVEKAATLPQTEPKNTNPVLEYLANERQNLQNARGISKGENAALWAKQVEVLKGAKLVPDKALSSYTKQEAETLVQFMYSKFKPTGTELIPSDERETA